MVRSNVDFPIPLTPTIAANSPFERLKEISLAIRFEPYPIVKDLIFKWLNVSEILMILNF